MDMKSTHKVEVVKLGAIEKHPNADKLGITKIWDYVVVVQLQQFKEGDLAAYVPPDSVLPDKPEYAFLNGHFRIKVRRLRQVLSQGLLLPAPAGAKEGDNVADLLGIVHYEPPVPQTMGEVESPPEGFYPVYDVDSMFRYATVFQAGEEVLCTEKIHGTSCKAVWADGRLWCGSRATFRTESEGNVYWRAVKNTPGVVDFLQSHPGLVLYGEVYGWVQDLRYGAKQPGQVWFRAFDILDGTRWLDFDDAHALAPDLPWVPVVFRGPFDLEKLKELSSGPSLLKGADHIREGIVVKPVKERTDLEIGRVQLKLISNDYLERH